MRTFIPFCQNKFGYANKRPQISSPNNQQKIMTLTPIKKAVIITEYNLILETLQKTNFNKSKAAEILGINRSSITNKITAYNKLKSEEEAQVKNKTISETY